MTLVELGALGEFVGAIGVVVTLIYLAIQIRQNTQATRAASFHAVYDSMNHVNTTVIQNVDLTRIWLAGLADREALSPEDRHRFDFTMLSYMHVFETMHFQARVGIGDAELVVAESKTNLGSMDVEVETVEPAELELPLAIAAAQGHRFCHPVRN